MSSYTPAEWLYNLFSQLVPYWRIMANMKRVLTTQQAMEIFRAGLEQGGCKPIDSHAFQCSGTYTRIGSIPICGLFEIESETVKGEGNRRFLRPLAVGLDLPWFYLFVCVNELSLELRGQQVILDSAIFMGQLPTGELRIRFILYIPNNRQQIYLAIFSSPTEIWWEFITKEDEERINAVGLTVPDVVSAILNSEKARSTLEDGVRRLMDILPKVIRGLAAYLLY